MPTNQTLHALPSSPMCSRMSSASSPKISSYPDFPAGFLNATVSTRWGRSCTLARIWSTMNPGDGHTVSKRRCTCIVVHSMYGKFNNILKLFYFDRHTVWYQTTARSTTNWLYYSDNKLYFNNEPSYMDKSYCIIMIWSSPS